ncbi:MAG: hypothetical protein IIZ06_00405 [Kiritimatiellae bacterium]|nr:hypothetical protein [Kiritimatiellia bacterium]
MTNNAANRRFWLCRWVVPIYKSVPIKLAQLDFATKSAKVLFQLIWHKCQSFSDNWHNKNPYKQWEKRAFVPMCQFTSYSTQVREIPKKVKKYISVWD